MTTKKKSPKQFWFLLKLTWKAKPSFMILTIIGAFLSVAQLIGEIVLPKFLIDEIQRLITDGKMNVSFSDFTLKSFIVYFQFLFLLVGTVLIFHLVTNFLLKLFDRAFTLSSKKMQNAIMIELTKKVMSLDYQYLEDPTYLDMVKRATFAIDNQNALEGFLRQISDVLKKVLSLVAIFSLIFLLHYLVIVFLLITSIIITLLNLRLQKFMVSFYQGIVPLNRRYGYYIQLAFDEKFNKDAKLFDGTEMAVERLDRFNRSIYEEFKIVYNREGVNAGVTGFINIFQNAVVYLYVSLRVLGKLGKRISIGEFQMYVQAATRFGTTFTELTRSLGGVYQSLGFLQPFCQFMAIGVHPVVEGAKTLEKIESIRFENVSFHYPRSDKLVLDDVSLTIKAKEKISIVGLNGAGKTTLIKLLCRMYQPISGTIYVNEVPIENYNYESYLRQISAVFQDYKILAYSIEKNICGSTPFNLEKLERIVDEVGLTERIKELPNGLKTELNKKFNESGIELSGGQNQKVGIARALYKDSELVILDEPTSALDPFSEAEIYQNFNDMVKHSTAIYISHRMSSSVFCDKVLVIDNGKVVDFAPHSELMNKTDQLYYKLFSSQAKNYQV